MSDLQKYLVVNADDFGQSPEINNGIIKAFEEGIVTSTSFMVRYPAATDAAGYARKKNFDLGLHVDLGEWMLKDDEWVPVYEVVDLADIESVRSEIDRQLEAFKRMTGKNPSHIDSHQHVHKRKELLPLFIDLSQKLFVPLRHYNNQIKYCGDFYGQNYDGSANHDAISENGLSNTLRKIDYGITELACHPGINITLNTLYKSERDTEVNTLCSKKIRELISAENIKLISFSELHG